MAKPNMIETPDAYKTYIQTKHRSEAAWHEPTWRAVTQSPNSTALLDSQAELP